MQIRVRGAVQGVGFRPFVYRLAGSLRLVGWVENSPQGVTIEVEGPESALAEFLHRLDSEKPALARSVSREWSHLQPCGEKRFEIRTSGQSGPRTAIVLPDFATCPDCLDDVFNVQNRRHRYPFTNCTHCGPRFSIIEALPYDRINTSMRGFEMCEACRREYDNPADRRFHAQPNACPHCGPHLELWDRDGRLAEACDDALVAAARIVSAGGILALKGLGGFQLIVDARNADSVRELRRRKHREEKPLALMVPTLRGAEALGVLGELERRLLTSPQAPITLVRRSEQSRSLIADEVAPAGPYLGLMLPYTPLHHLLVRELGFPVVATSGNQSDEPICTDEHDALNRLGGIADAFLVHNRPIVRHVDDSVVQVACDREMVLRRARGYAPLPIPGAMVEDPVLAVGAHQKNTAALALNGQVFVSQHIGDLTTPQALEAFDRAVIDLPGLYETKPRLIACDLHPDYLSTRRAEQCAKQPLRVHHHHAHVLSCMADNGLVGSVLGVAWDGTGYGPDGTVWGGEFLRCVRSKYERVAHLRTFSLPGGELASREPRRSGLGVLAAILGDSVFDRRELLPVRALEPSELRLVRSAMKRGVNCPITSSMGRMFDAVASIIGIRQRVRDEGWAAMELEFAAMGDSTTSSYPIVINGGSADDLGAGGDGRGLPWIVDWRPMISVILADVERNEPPGRIARKFHNALADMIVAVSRLAGDPRVALSGGCFQNRLLLELTVAELEKEGFRPYWHGQVPPNDGGIAVGQAVMALEQLKRGDLCV